MKTPEERRWERMQQLLLAESRGDAPVRLESRRTLFGIKSHVEQVIERTVAEDAETCRKRTAGKGGSRQPDEPAPAAEHETQAPL